VCTPSRSDRRDARESPRHPLRLVCRAVLCALFWLASTLTPPNASASAPRAGEVDLEVYDLSGFPGSGSYVRVRENEIHGTRLRFKPDLGIDTVQIPELWATYWLTSHDALQLQFHYFVADGSKFTDEPVFYNGASIQGGQTLHASGSPWATLGLYYERLLLPESSGIDLRAKLGIEYTYLDFDLDHPRLAPDTVGTETREDFNTQELPMPTIGLESRNALNDHFSIETLLLGNWLNHVDSLRTEGGTIYLSQREVQAHARLVYSNQPRLGQLRIFLGVGYFYYQQKETSHEDGNFIRLTAPGPEFGLAYSF
jgi:hypothetical protein